MTEIKEQLVASMRSFRFEGLNLELKNAKSTDMPSGGSEQLKAPIWVGLLFAISALVTLVLGWILFPYSIAIAGKLVPNYLPLLGIWFLALITGLVTLAIMNGKSDRKWELFARANGFSLHNGPTNIPADLIQAEGVTQAFQLHAPVGYRVTFGTAKCWFDYDSPKPVKKENSIFDGLRELIFIRVHLPRLSQTPVYGNPKRPIDFKQLPKMSAKAKAAVDELASQYSVVIGARGVVVCYAASTTLPASRSMEENDLTQDDVWINFTDIISGKLADVIEGFDFPESM
jgi:hypothetical protein